MEVFFESGDVISGGEKVSNSSIGQEPVKSLHKFSTKSAYEDLNLCTVVVGILKSDIDFIVQLLEFCCGVKHIE